MYSGERDHHAAAARTAYDGTSCRLQPCAADRSIIQLAGEHHQRGQVDPAGSADAGVQQQPRRANKKKHGARPPSRRSSTTVVATDVANFRAMVQELTGFPPAAIFRPLPRRVHAAVSSPFVLAAGHTADGRGQGSETATNATAGSRSPDAPAAQPVMMAQLPPCAPPALFDGLSDIGSPVFDTWDDLSIE